MSTGLAGCQLRRWTGSWTLASAVPLMMGGPLVGQVTYTVFPPHVTSAEAQPTGKNGATPVTVTLRDSTLQYTLNEIGRQAHLRLIFSTSPVLERRTTVRLMAVPAMQAIATVLRGTGLEAKTASDGETVVIRNAEGRSPAKVAGGIITGRVTDSTTGAGLNGAQVRVEGAPKLTIVTADSGQFTLKNVPPGDQVLQVRLFGYRPVNRTITVVDGERTTVRIAMASVPTVLSGVVTTATGMRRRVELGNDITTINVDSVMQVAPISSVTDLLETRVPGLTVLHTSGEPGNPSRIRIRGASSISGNNDPIVIMNGVRVYASQSDKRNQNLASSRDVSYNTGTNAGSIGSYAAPSPLDQIDPNSIETIEVFKGPSATAIYGSDAANGVIIITTKHGHPGPAHWSLTVGDGVNWLPGSWPTNYYKFGLGVLNQQSGSPFCFWYDVTCERDSLVAFQALNDPRYSVFAHGSDQTADLTVSGGVPTLLYSVTGSAAGDVGNLKLPAIEVQRYEKFYGPIPGWMRRPDNYQHWGLSGQLTAQPTPQVSVTLQSSLFNSQQQQGSLQQAIGQLEGEYIDASQLSSTPLIQNDVERATDAQVTSTNALTLSWQPYTWLPLSLTGGLNTIQRNDATYIPYGVNYSGAGVCQAASIGCADTTGSYSLGRGTSQDKTLNVSTILPVLRLLSLGVGGNLHSQSTADVSASTKQLAPGVSVPTTFPTLNDMSSFSQATSATSTYGWYAEPRFNLNSRFFVSPGVQLGGGSASGARAGLTGFPKIDFSYVAVDRSHPRGLLTLLRPRVAFGYAGTQPGPAQKLRLLNGLGGSANGLGGNTGIISLDGSTFVPTLEVATLGNTKLRPERSRELEGGLDAELWQGRLTVTYTQYNKTRTDAIISIPVAPSVNGNSGSYYTNLGVIRNTGTELTVAAQLLESRALSWQVGGNLSNNNNRVVRLNPGQLPIITSVTRIVPGYPLSGIWAFPIVAFADANQDGVIDPNEIRTGDSAAFLGQSDPKYQLNLNTGVTLLNGRLSVNATFAYQNGLTQTNEGLLTSGGFAVLPNTPGTSLAAQAAVVAATNAVSCHGGCYPTNYGLTQTVNTFRFNDLSVNYTLPTDLIRWLHVPRASLALQGQNLGLHTNYRGKDPNVNVFSTNQVEGGSGLSYGDQTADAGQVPQPRIWWLKFTLGN